MTALIAWLSRLSVSSQEGAYQQLWYRELSNTYPMGRHIPYINKVVVFELKVSRYPGRRWTIRFFNQQQSTRFSIRAPCLHCQSLRLRNLYRNIWMQLEEWWLNSAYLEVRFSSQLNVNFGGPAPYLEHYWPPKAGTQLERTSIAVWFTLLYWDLIRTPRRDDRDCSAVAKHNKLMNEAQHGKEGLPVYGLYNDPACTKSGGGGHFVLSTSLVGCTTGLGGVVPRVHHGYGFFYRIRDDRIVVACTAWKSCPETDADKFFQNLSKSIP